MRPTRSQEDIEGEFGEPLKELILSLRQEEYRWETVAGILDVPLGTLRRWVTKLGIKDSNRYVNYPHSPIRNRAIELGYSDIQAMIRDYRSSGKTLNKLAEDLGVWANKLYRHMPPDIRGEWALDPSQKKNNPAGGWRNRDGEETKWGKR